VGIREEWSNAFGLAMRSVSYFTGAYTGRSFEEPELGSSAPPVGESAQISRSYFFEVLFSVYSCWNSDVLVVVGRKK
jgi:hypothetical protein